jgi:hypothetical protein
MSTKPWAEMTDREKCEAMAPIDDSLTDDLPCGNYPCFGEGLTLPCIMSRGKGSCPDIAARLLKEGKV